MSVSWNSWLEDVDMAETGLLDFQMQEWMDAARYVVCGLAFIIGSGMWIRATFFMED